MSEANKSFDNEEWKEVKFEDGFTNKFGLEVSNYGRVRSFDYSTGKPVNLLAGAKQEGYLIIRKKLFLPQLSEVRRKLDVMKREIVLLYAEMAGRTSADHDNFDRVLKDRKKKYANAMNKETRKRTTNIGLLVHRLVAEFWCKKENEKQTLVLHKDYNKINNHYSNLQWATMEESIAHQQLNPNVIAEKISRKDGSREKYANQKLTVIRVMLIKKRLLEGRTMRQLAKQFKVTETQIARIKKGENWANVPAAS